MCGIIGGIGNGITKEMIVTGLVATQSRGKDATGLYQPKGGITKAPGNAEEFVKKHGDAIVKDKMFIGHCRLPTAGAPTDNNNNHPFDGEKFISVHNGTCPLMKDIKEYQYQGECDSEVLHSYLETHGLEKGLKEVEGSASLLIAPKDGSYELYLWRHTNPLILGYNEKKNLLLMASTESIIRTAISTEMLQGLIVKTQPGFVFTSVGEHELWKVFIDSNGKVNAEFIDTIKPSPTRSYTSTGTNYNSGYVGSYYNRNEGWLNRNPQFGSGGSTRYLNGWDKRHNYDARPYYSLGNDKVPHTYTDCPDIGFNEDECNKCPKIRGCRELASITIEEDIKKSASTIMTEKFCDGEFDSSISLCRTCVLRTLCAYDIVENWDEENWMSMLYEPDNLDLDKDLEPPFSSCRSYNGEGVLTDEKLICNRCGYEDTHAHLLNQKDQYTCPKCENVTTPAQTPMLLQ